MKAVRVEAFGSEERLVVTDVPAPEPGPGQVRVHVKACGLNFSDLLQRAGDYVGGPRPPFVSGSEAAGIVEETGERVAVLVEGGAHAEQLVARREACIPIPEAIGFEEAAGFPISYLTAYHALVTQARAKPGETVLVLAAAGGFGTAAVQIALRLDLRVVGVASTARKRDHVLALGAEVALGYEAARREACDVVLDPVGGPPLRDALRRLRPFGRAVVVGCASRRPLPIDPIGLMFRTQAVLGLHLAAVIQRPDLVAEARGALLGWWEKGEIRVQVGDVLPLERVAEAHARLAGREILGKLVLVP